ncbi:maleylpyruvate isomerase family mycothiol-dependent enzyme [Streptomyces verrucosisporus]|uniref:maleylpyruvate isomerase family mycothiol-dependent enzyme n=1 Tax=Streptomyces verrucosisporus TaxID=1695161 RepID=UPI0019D2E664|nr:maleylpyruvate isomerase family mycothiol-dependent enzyme [Streptomyces verrucosisporus]MBN3928458.1 maleylpyruvate isomerase family mycothiol-dependent enzyme [Streptomyces verrucosisporus]
MTVPAAGPAGPTADPVADTAALRESTDRLLAAVRKLDDAALAAPSKLPGWTRGHVLAHLARNADALVNVLAGRPMYSSAEAREADIERDAPRPQAAQLEDLSGSAARLDEAMARLTGEQWGATVELRNGVTDLASSIPFRRRIEVELHHVDLGVGYGLADMPASFTDRELENMARRFAGHPDVEPVELRVEDGRVLRTGRAAGRGERAVTVAGSPTALVGWLTGRTDGTGLTASAASLPALPPL